MTFVLPGAGNIPVGGFKVVYEYANRLSRRGHSVSVVHVAQPDREATVTERLKKLARFIQRRFDGSHRPSWFRLEPEVTELWRFTPAPGGVPDAEVVIATSWQTAEWVASYPPAKGVGYYLIQHHETWSGAAARVNRTFRLGLHNLAIARWLQEVVLEHGAGATYLPNGLDFGAFGVDLPLAAREPRVMMLYHHANWKGSADGLAALERVKKALPDVRATLYGTPEAPADLPAWISYYQRPDPATLRRLYNESAVFMATSWTEGWGLMGCEALMCGCALAATDAGGHKEYARHRETALLSPVKNPEALAHNVLTLLSDAPLRVQLAEQGNAYIQRFTWEGAVQRLEHALSSPSDSSYL